MSAPIQMEEGGGDEADCYYRDEKVAHLRVVERDGKLADSIKAARLDRAKELSRLRKSLLKTANRMLGQTPSNMPPDMPIILPPSDAAAEEAPLDVPDLETESDDE